MNDMRKLIDTVSKLTEAEDTGISLFDLFHGNVGVLVDSPEDIIEINGYEYEFGNMLNTDVETFVSKYYDESKSNLLLFVSDGYRGKGAYTGAIKVKGSWYGLDIANDNGVYKLKKVV